MILKPQVSDGPKLNLVRERAEYYTTKEGNLTVLLNHNLQCDYDNFQAHSVGESTQGPASGILATETETERGGEVKLGQHLQGLDSLQPDALFSLWLDRFLLQTSHSQWSRVTEHTFTMWAAPVHRIRIIELTRLEQTFEIISMFVPTQGWNLILPFLGWV